MQNITEIHNAKQKGCYHLRIGRVFIQDQTFITLENKKTNVFKLLLRQEIPSLKIDNSDRLSYLNKI